MMMIISAVSYLRPMDTFPYSGMVARKMHGKLSSEVEDSKYNWEDIPVLRVLPSIIYEARLKRRLLRWLVCAR